MTPWPECGKELLAELDRTPGRVALAVDDTSGIVAEAFAGLWQTIAYRAGTSLLAPQAPTSPEELVDRLVAAGPVIVDLDILFWKPWLALDPLGVIRAVSRRRSATLFAWPGTIDNARAAYSSPGRRDWFEATLTDAVVLRPAPTQFPDEPPYRIERYP
ncbi:MAG TPA: hypothetical protein VNF75_07180 [Candidatus Dormibacteraeota bacterium]|nr:hypothetical protein [Candidatus Dormibacteraeota bacterium]